MNNIIIDKNNKFQKVCGKLKKNGNYTLVLTHAVNLFNWQLFHFSKKPGIQQALFFIVHNYTLYTITLRHFYKVVTVIGLLKVKWCVSYKSAYF